jgi:Transglutaminase-like superfamily
LNRSLVGHSIACNAARRQAWLLLALAIAMATAVPACQKTDAAAKGDEREIWEVYYLQGAKIGYGRTNIRELSRAGRRLVAVDSLNHLVISRFGQKAEQEVTLSTLESPTGELVEFKTEMASGPSPATVSGHVVGKELVIEVGTKGRSETARLPWSDEIGGFRAVEQSLERRPLAAGEKRSLKMLMPLVNQVADVELSAGTIESTSVLGIESKLLRIETSAQLAGGQTLNSTLWVDAAGQTIKTRIEALEQESFRTTRALALADGSPATFDLGSDLIVKLDPPLENAHETRLVRYRVELSGGDPAKVFASGPTQSVRSLGPHEAEITVRSIRPSDARHATQQGAAVDKEYLASNSVLQIDDPRVRQMAEEGRGSATDPADVALALERYVHRVMTRRNFSQAFSTAAEVAETREGDCTEHAVLLAALARACGIPSRVAIGLVYVERAGGFGFHMWTEMLLDGQWTPFDATLGQGGIGASHLKLTDSSLAGASAYSSFLPVAQVVGQLKVSVIAAE